MTERGKHSQEPRITKLLSEIDGLADPELHPELNETETLDRLLTLQVFTARITLPSDTLLTRLEKIKNRLITKPDSYQNEKEFRKILMEIEENNQHRFRFKDDKDPI